MDSDDYYDEKYQIKSPADAANLIIPEFTYWGREKRPICTCETDAEK